MPVTRSVRRDVILRVPKVGLKDKPSVSSSGHAGLEMGGDTAGNGSSMPRRSTSPAKKTTSQPEHYGNRGTETGAEMMGGYQYAAQATSAAEWNSLLIWARRQRGPQWDAATGIWQVDEGSTEYYSFGNDPARHTKLSTANAVEDEHNGVEGDVKPEGEGEANRMDESIDGEVSHVGSYNIEDSPPIGPGGRRSRAR